MTTITDAVRGAIQYQLNNVHTALPATIISYDYTQQKASVQPSIKKRYADDSMQAIDLPVINNVPVIFPISGTASITFPINEGDFCLLVFIERSTDQWKSNGPGYQPDDPRKFDLSDAIAIPGLLPFNATFPATNNTDFVIKYGNSSITITDSGEIEINSGTETSSITSTGDINISASGTLTANGTAGAELKSSGTAKVNGTLVAMGNSLTGVELIAQVEAIIDALNTSAAALSAIPLFAPGVPAWTAQTAALTAIRVLLESIRGTL